MGTVIKKQESLVSFSSKHILIFISIHSGVRPEIHVIRVETTVWCEINLHYFYCWNIWAIKYFPLIIRYSVMSLQMEYQ